MRGGWRARISFRTRNDEGELVEDPAEHEAIREMIGLRTQGKPLGAIPKAMRAKGLKISHEGVAGVLRAAAG